VLSTCHKGKGTEEDIVQLAGDFQYVADRRKVAAAEVRDEANLSYVAATRAKLGLVLNKDLERLMSPEKQGRVLIEVSGTACCVPRSTGRGHHTAAALQGHCCPGRKHCCAERVQWSVRITGHHDRSPCDDRSS
jgi:ATP-dependent exoDNAse (exonuclease V) beta subunit